MAGVGPLEDRHPRVRAEFPGELSVADVHRVDPARSPLKQHVGEPAGRGADIDGDRPGGIDPKMIEGVGELDPAARDPGMRRAADVEFGVGGQ